MKINQIIREKRKELSLTQEQIAEFLGVSTPAVSKWERGSTYPDITLLPALARLLRTDLNTLLSFSDDLSDIEIKNFVNALDQTIQERGYDAAFHKALHRIREYPTCEKLIFSVTLYLEGALALYNVSESGQYREAYEAFYRRLAASDTPEIRDTAAGMLISYARNRGDFSKAEELIRDLPFSAIDREEQLAILYQQQKRYGDAEKIWERRVLRGAAEMQTALINLLETALLEERESDAAFLADVYEALTRLLCFPEWMCCNAHLQLALAKKDRERSLSVLQKMLPAMKNEWHPQDCPLYRSAGCGASADFSSKLAQKICDELMNSEEYAFLRGGAGLEALIPQ